MERSEILLLLLFCAFGEGTSRIVALWIFCRWIKTGWDAPRNAYIASLGTKDYDIKLGEEIEASGPPQRAKEDLVSL